MGKSDANKLEFWTKAEYDRFIAGIEPGSEDYLIFEILFWTGIREGELLALSLSDFDMSGNLLHINKTYNRIRKRDVIDTPKTENSVRTIDIPNFLKEEVQEYSKKHYGFPEDQRLFPIVARTLQKRLKKYEALTGVKPIRVHDIRHSHVAYLIYQGVEPLIIKERLGHKDIQMTLNTYGHLYPSQRKKGKLRCWTTNNRGRRHMKTKKVVRKIFDTLNYSKKLKISPFYRIEIRIMRFFLN